MGVVLLIWSSSSPRRRWAVQLESFKDAILRCLHLWQGDFMLNLSIHVDSTTGYILRTGSLLDIKISWVYRLGQF